MEKARLFFKYIYHLPILFRFREFFLYFADTFIDLMKVNANKHYLVDKQRGFVGGYCSRQFISYAPNLIQDKIKKAAHKNFKDKLSINLYIKVFNRHIYSSLLIPGWSRFYDKNMIFNKKLKGILSKISSKTIFHGNYLSSRDEGPAYQLNFKDGRKYLLPHNWFEISVFCFDLGMKRLNKLQKQYVLNRSIIDAGAYIGDSGIVFSRYTNKKVYAFEPSPENFKKMQSTIKINHLEKKLIPCMVALGSKDGSSGFRGAGAGAMVDESSGIKVKVATLDTYMKRRKSKIGVIKMDVEGCEMDILKGCKKIIKSDKPILLLSIYHSAEQYLKIPAYMTKNYSKTYNLSFIDCNPVHPLAEKVLLCVPKKI